MWSSDDVKDLTSSISLVTVVSLERTPQRSMPHFASRFNATLNRQDDDIRKCHGELQQITKSGPGPWHTNSELDLVNMQYSNRLRKV